MSSIPQSGVERRVEILVHDIKVKDLRSQLTEHIPDNVFPVKVSVELTRSQVDDQTFKRMRPPAYPVKVKESRHQPYIPPKTVYFENPAMFPKQDATAWTLEDFADKMGEVITELGRESLSASDRLYLTDVELVEIPEVYAVEGADGTRSWDKSLYEDRAEMTIGTFDKRPTISDDAVRRQLGDSAPGEVIQPLRLTRVREVNAKEHRGTSDTSAINTRRRYFSDGQADQYSDPGLAPTEWDFEDNPDIQRSLGQNAKTAVREWFPELSQSKFMDVVRFEGEMIDSSTFVEEGVDFL